jgi:two-component system LytT family sensor kinase
MPENARRRSWLWRAGALIVGATGLGLLFGSRTYLLYNAYPDNAISLVDAMVPSVTDWFLWAPLVPAIVWAARRFPIEASTWRRAIALHLVLGTGAALIKFGIDVWAGGVLPWVPARGFSRAAFVFDLYPNALTYWVLLVAVHALDYGRRLRDRELRASQLEAALARVQLQVLRMQLQPHFLFNTLNAVTTLMHRDVDAAERMLVRLSDLLRLTIEKIGVQDVSLREEVEFLQSYLAIEETRFQDRLTVLLQVGPEVMDARVPHLILQPLVENSIRHGVEKRSNPGRIEVAAARRNGLLELSVTDEGPGLPDGFVASTSKGLGLRNVRERLRRLYGPNHELEVSNRAGGGVLARMTLPFSTTSMPQEQGREQDV